VREPLARVLRWGAGTKVRSSPARPRERRVSSPVCWEHSALAWVREPLAHIMCRSAGTKVRSSPARHWKRRVSSPVCGSIVRLPGCASLWPASCAGVRERRYGQARRDIGSGGFPPPFVGSIVRLPGCASLWPASCACLGARASGSHRALAWVREPLARIVRSPGCASLWLASCAGVPERRYGQARRDLGSGGFPPPFVGSMEVLAEQREVDTPMKFSRPLHTRAGDPCAWLFA